MGCGKCDIVPEINDAFESIFIMLPTNHRRVTFENWLTNTLITYKHFDDGYLIYTSSVDEFFGKYILNYFNSVEMKDVKLLPLKNKNEITFSDLKNFKSLKEWQDIINGKQVIQIIKHQRIKTLFQPIIDIRNNEIYGYEALNRGILPDGSLMQPGVLFSKAKEIDLLFNLDRICREASIKAASSQNIKSKIFINFIPTAIYQPELCLKSTLQTLVDEHIDPRQVVFEVVESEKVVDYEHLNRILNYYRNKGFSVALDDIGSGYSNVEFLLNLKPDYMKIDMSIIRGIDKSPDQQLILKELVMHGRMLNQKILAEGIETVEEYNYIKSQDIDLVQGFYFGKPSETPIL
jgi:EAL domain-containing protein (putative c-di-GMP-specific phosphodiesterase class I)